jgi:putative ABC transport system substrate-binding protein
MRRRDAFGVIGSAAAWPIVAHAQSLKKLPAIGFIATAGGTQSRMINAFKEGLREVGYVEGTNITLEHRTADNKVERFPVLAAELVELHVDVILATNSLVALAAKQATSTIPIVVPVMGDPVGDGLVASLARPESNITGLTFLGPELLPKRLALLKEALPSASRVAALWHPGAYGEATMNDMLKRAEAGARSLDVNLQLTAVQGYDEIGQALSKMATERADALLVFPSPMLFNGLRSIADLAAQFRLPAMAMGKEFVEFGGLMAYGANIADLHRRAAAYVDKILKGARATDLPVEQPVSFEFLINMKTARALGLTIPPTLLARADEVIE